MLNTDLIDECLVVQHPLTQKQKNKFVREFCENLKSKVNIDEFKKRREYESIAGYLAGKDGRLKMGGYGTVGDLRNYLIFDYIFR